MYEKFERSIADFSSERNPGDFWYDCAILEAIDILRAFDENDWARLSSQLEFKDVFWKKRLVECLGEVHVSQELNVILSVIGTCDDEDLQVASIDVLRSFNLFELRESERKSLRGRAIVLLDGASPPVAAVIKRFVAKLDA